MAKINEQPIINIGMLGSVSDGKSTTVFQLTGTKTQRHSREMKRNITIKPGYANMKIYKDNDILNTTGGTLVHNISFIDCPGHYELILTMMSCIKLMNGIILVVSAAEPLEKKPQLLQHILAIKLSGIKNIIVCLNKLDLVKKNIVVQRKNQLEILLKQYDISPMCIIPVCMSQGIGVNYLLENIMKYMGPDKVVNNDRIQPLFMITRSFDINKLNIPTTKMVGGVVGGSLIQGTLKVGDMIEIKPGIMNKDKDGNTKYIPHITPILSLKSEEIDLVNISPGGLIGIGTNIDMFYCKNDMMIGDMIGLVGQLPDCKTTLSIIYTKVEFDSYVWNPILNSNVSIVVGTKVVNSRIVELNTNIRTISIILDRPVCINNADNIILCTKSTDGFHIVAFGNEQM